MKNRILSKIKKVCHFYFNNIASNRIITTEFQKGTDKGIWK